MHRSKWRSVLILIVALLGFSIVVLFSWNSFAPDLFLLPTMMFKQAFGFVTFVFCCSLLIGSATGVFPRRKQNKYSGGVKS